MEDCGALGHFVRLCESAIGFARFGCPVDLSESVADAARTVLRNADSPRTWVGPRTPDLIPRDDYGMAGWSKVELKASKSNRMEGRYSHRRENGRRNPSRRRDGIC